MLHSQSQRRLPRQNRSALALLTAFAVAVGGGALATAGPASASTGASSSVVRPSRPAASVMSVPSAIKGTSDRASAASPAASSAKVVTPPPMLTIPAKGTVLTGPEQAAVASAKASGQSVEVVSERTDRSSVLVAPSGAVTQVLYAEPFRIQVGDTWKSFDTTLAPDANGLLAPTQAAALQTFSAGGSGPLATLQAPLGDVSVGWPSTLPTPTVSKDTATYANVASNTDLSVTSQPTAFEFKIILKVRPTIAPVFNLPVTVPAGARITTLDSGVPMVQDASGKDIALIGTAQMSDSSIDPATRLPGAVKSVPSAVTAAAGAWNLTLRPDMSFLSAPATKYPVTIDPSVQLQTNLDTMVINGSSANNNYDSNADLYVGYNSTYGTLARSYVRLADSAIKSKYITVGSLSLDQDTSATCSARQTNVKGSAQLTAGRTWNTAPAIGSVVYGSFSTQYGAANSCGSGLVPPTDILGLVQSWAANTATTEDTLAMVANSESDGSYFKAFFSADTSYGPHVNVTYATAPGAPTIGTATAGSQQAVVRWTDPSSNGGAAITQYKITASPGGQTATVSGATATSGTITGLTNGTAYNFVVQAINGAGTSPASAPSNTVTPMAPSVPTAVSTQHNDTFAPLLLATLNDPNGNNLTGVFTVKDSSGTTVVTRTSTVVASGSAASVAVIAGELHAGQHYTFTVHACLSAGPCSAESSSHPVLDPALAAGQKSSFTYDTYKLTDRASLKVNVATGNLLIQNQDLSVPGIGSDLVVGRSFNSSQTDGTTFGSPWRLTTTPDYQLALSTDFREATLTDPSGGVWGFTSTVGTGAFTYTSPPGSDSTLQHNADGTLLLTVHSSNEKLTFDATGRLTTDKDRNSNTPTFTPSSGPVTAIVGTRGTNPGNEVDLTYSGPNSQLSSISQSDGAGDTRTVSYGYDTSNRLANVTEANGRYTSYTYNANDQVTSIVISDGTGSLETDIGYDSTGRVNSLTEDPTGRDAITTYDYSTAGHTHVYDANHPRPGGGGGVYTDYGYDYAGRVTSTTDPLGHATTTGWTADNQTSMTQNGSDPATSYTYGSNPGDNGGESLTQTTDPVGGINTSAYGNTGSSQYSPSSSTDQSNRPTAYTYDGPGNLASSSDGTTAAVATVNHNSDGTVSMSINPGNDPANGGTGIAGLTRCGAANGSQVVGNCTSYTYSNHQLTGVTPPQQPTPPFRRPGDRRHDADLRRLQPRRHLHQRQRHHRDLHLRHARPGRQNDLQQQRPRSRLRLHTARRPRQPNRRHRNHQLHLRQPGQPHRQNHHRRDQLPQHGHHVLQLRPDRGGHLQRRRRRHHELHLRRRRRSHPGQRPAGKR